MRLARRVQSQVRSSGAGRCPSSALFRGRSKHSSTASLLSLAGHAIAQQSKVNREVSRWANHRNEQQVGVDWQFTTEDAGIKLKHLHPHIKT